MYLLIDAQALQTPGSRNRGIGRYSQDLIRGLAAVRPDWNIEVVQASHMPLIDAGSIGGLPIRTFHPPLEACPSRFENRDLNERFYADWLLDIGADGLVLCSAFEDHSLIPWFTDLRPKIYATVLYDLIPLIYSHNYLPNAGAHLWYARRLQQVCQGNRLLSISRASADDFRALGLNNAPEVINIRGATNDGFTPPDPYHLHELAQQLNVRFGIDKEFILYVGGADYRKNMTGALDAYAHLPLDTRQRYELVIACKLTPTEREQLKQAGERRGIGESLRLTGFVTDAELRALYQTCRVFFFPSFYEGLGLPVLEALQCGAPVVASNCSSIPEYAGNVSWLASPHDPQSMANALQEALREPRGLRLSQRLEFVAGFTWQDTAERAALALEAAPKVAACPRRRRIAWVSPMPPIASGIADYSEELVRPLSEQFDIDLVVDSTADHPTAALAVRHPVITDRELVNRNAAQPYDLVVYHLGNSHYHHYMVPLMHRLPGLLVLHDFYLGGLMWTAHDRGYWPIPIEQELAEQGEHALKYAYSKNALHKWVLDDVVSLNHRPVMLADAVAVHSRWSWGRLKRMTDAPVYHIPFHAPPAENMGSRQRERQRLGLPRSGFVISSLGLLAPPKRIDALIRAVSSLPPAVRSACRVVLAGHTSDAYRDELLNLARELGIGPQVRFYGSVSLRDFVGHAWAADICVQLRYPTRGETSASLMRALSVGAACITSDQGPMGELPNDVTIKIRTPHREVEDLAAAIQRLYEHPDQIESMRRAAQRYISEHHSLDHTVAHYAAIIEQMIATRKAADRSWLDAFRGCVAEYPGKIPEEMLADWADLRQSVRATSKTATLGPPNRRHAA